MRGNLVLSEILVEEGANLAVVVTDYGWVGLAYREYTPRYGFRWIWL